MTITTSELPEFAEEWVRQWKQAAPKLQAIRDAELRAQNDRSKDLNVQLKRSTGVRLYEKDPLRNGMVAMQQWLMRRRLLELTAMVSATGEQSPTGDG